VSAPTAIEIGDELRIGDAAFVVTKPGGAEILSRGRRKSEKTFTLRGAVEAMLLTFAIGFGAAQYLAYFFYHKQNRLILAEAVPIDHGGPVSTMTRASTATTHRHQRLRSNRCQHLNPLCQRPTLGPRPNAKTLVQRARFIRRRDQHEGPSFRL